MSTGLTPLHRHGPLQSAWRVLAALAALMLTAIVVLVLAEPTSNTTSTRSSTGSGVAATQSRSLAPFTGVQLTGSNNVVVRVGARQSVLVHADTNLVRRITTQVSSGVLVIGNTPGALNARSPMFVVVHVPSLAVVTVQGSGTISVAGIKSPSLTLRIPGSGTIHAAGTAARLVVAIDGSGTALLNQLTARDATATIKGSGSVVLTTTHSLNASIPGSGTIVYTGNPAHVSKSVTGSGTISGP